MESVNPKTLKEKLRDRQLWVGFAAEFLATAVFVFMVCGATLRWSSSSPFVLHIALTVGLSIATLASTIGHITGGQINPVVTLGFIVTRRLHPLKGFLIIVGQFLGGKIFTETKQKKPEKKQLWIATLGSNCDCILVSKQRGKTDLYIIL
jgi:hypothetical protein